MKRKDIHDRVLQASSIDELASVYAEWADRYDEDLEKEMGYQAPTRVARLLRDHLAPEGVDLLDAGCGTGLVGVALSAMGYLAIDGFDYSSDMLNQAKKKGVYGSLWQADMLARLAVPARRYDAVTCVGTFTLGHVGPDALNELVRITRRGGYICFTVRSEAWEQDKYTAAISALVLEKACEVITNEVVVYIEEEMSTCHLCLFRVC